MLSVQVFGPGGKRSEYRSRIFWIDGRRTRAAAKALQRRDRTGDLRIMIPLNFPNTA